MPTKTNDAISRSDRVLVAALGIILATASAAIGASLTYHPSPEKIAASSCSGRLGSAGSSANPIARDQNAAMTLDTFVYDPDKAKGQLKLDVKGAFRFLAGAVAKQPDAQVAVATPIATVGVRGTEFWGGPIDEQALGVFLIEGSVTVTNAAGEVILDTAGQGTNIGTPGAAPGAVTIWPQDKVERALATVAFQ